MRKITQFFPSRHTPLFKVATTFAILLVMTACTTQKKKGDVGGLGKFYQNTTTEFNYYFNANVLLEESIAKLNEEHKDNYNQFLPVFKYVANTNPQSVAPQLDDAIKKVTVAKQLHPATHWMDDIYLMAGKAQYLKKDYESAEETLVYLSREFSPEAMAAKEKDAKKLRKKRKKKKVGKKKKSSKKKKRRKKKKRKKKKKKPSKKKSSSKKGAKKPAKKDTKAKKEKEPPVTEGEQPDKYFLKHRPCFQEGLLWLARTYIEREEYDEAELLLNELEYDSKTFKDVRRSVAPVRAHFFMKRKEYENAIAPLEKAVEYGKKKDKARYAYILGQIHNWAGNNEKAYAYFEQAMKQSPTYEMEFSSRLNLALNGYNSGKTPADATIKGLKKMLKDIKNEEYRDQIYYAMANIAIKENNENDAIAYLKNSLKYNTGNMAQKTESYLQLAEYYFAKDDFVNAKNYYDSTAQVMVKTDERFDKVVKFSQNLTDIAKNIEIITHYDSLLMVSAMTDEQKKELASKIKKQEEEARRKALLEGNKKVVNNKFNPPGRTPINPRAGGPNAQSTFPFYADDRARKKDARDFERKWGNRNLEDNWRRSNRQGVGVEEEEEVAEEVIDFRLTDEDIARILKDIPDTDEEIADAHQQIEEAMFKLGILYRDRLENNEKAVETLEELLKRYPHSAHEEEALYYLYVAYTDMDDSANAKLAYDRLMAKYADGTYARVLTDPNYLKQMNEEERKLTNYYNETYFKFKKGDYQDAFDRISKAGGMFGPTNMYQPKFALLSAMCMGNLKGKEDYVKGLKQVIAKHPDTPEETRAKEILRLLNAEEQAAAKPTPVSKKEGGLFKVADNKLHYFIIALTGEEDIKLSDAKIAVSDYNRKYHKLDKLRISNVMLGSASKGGTPVLVIRRFKNKKEAMNYYSGATNNSSDLLPDKVQYEMYPITQFNYRMVLKEKSLEGYKEFFAEHYME